MSFCKILTKKINLQHYKNVLNESHNWGFYRLKRSNQIRYGGSWRGKLENVTDIEITCWLSKFKHIIVCNWRVCSWVMCKLHVQVAKCVMKQMVQWYSDISGKKREKGEYLWRYALLLFCFVSFCFALGFCFFFFWKKFYCQAPSKQFPLDTTSFTNGKRWL